MHLFSRISPEAGRILDSLPVLIDKIFPVPGRFRPGISGDVRDLSALLTSERGGRPASYLEQPRLISAYLRYFLPWNIYRLCRLLPRLELSLAAGDAVTDLGSGPLTLPIALWIARSELRNLPLEFRCVDRAGAALDAGKKLLNALAARTLNSNEDISGGGNFPWIIKTIKAPLTAPVRGKAAALVTAINVFNESYQDIPHIDAGGLKRAAEKSAALLAGRTAANGRILVVEPGIPRAGEFISGLRGEFIKLGRKPDAPCTHCGTCPASGSGRPGQKGRWCHFAFDTEDAPADLLNLSDSAGIPKERAVLSFLYTMADGTADSGGNAAPSRPAPVRIISDAFPLPGGAAGKNNGVFGRYGCCEKGLVLLSGNRNSIEKYVSGSLFECTFSGGEKHDAKSGALVISL
jgi:hypothetical protein